MKYLTFQGFIGAILIMAAALAGALPAGAAEREQIIPGRPDITTRAIVVTPDPQKFSGPPRAAAILYVGGNGDLRAMKNNFLLRISQRLADAGLLLVIPDAPSDRAGRNNLQGNFRAGRDHAEDARGLVQFIKTQGDLPIFAIGTSRGSTSAANAAGRLGPELIAGVALTSSVTRKGQQGQISVYEAPVDKIVQPAFIMWHSADACSETTPDDAPKLAPALKASSKVTVKTLSGGSAPRSGPCDALSPHGFVGIEDQAADAIIAWIDETLAAKR